MTLTDAQRKLLVEAISKEGDSKRGWGEYAANWQERINNARELAALIEGAESVTVEPKRSGEMSGDHPDFQRWIRGEV